MGLNIGGRNVAETRIQGVTLNSIVGGYELVFGLMLDIFPDENGSQASVIGAQVSVVGGGGEPETKLGFARPEGSFEVIARTHTIRGTPNLYLYLQPSQIAALETLRDGSDLTFRLLLRGTAKDENGEQYVADELRIPVSRSDWIQKLREAHARNVILLEVPLPLESTSDEWASVSAGLQRAEEQFRNGDYVSCVGSCRMVMEELGNRSYPEERWPDKALDRLHSDRRGMNKQEREMALWAAIRHYTHPAHHAPSEGGVPAYGRLEAQFTLTLTATAVAHVRAI